ncbi:MAG: hypothetical protein MZV63_61920 [Marinilabiliales bacterium]|nr:hypothetical protein [Marinilabiliales bacterium]
MRSRKTFTGKRSNSGPEIHIRLTPGSEFRDIIENKGGFVMAHWDGTAETEEKIKNLTKATIRAIPFDSPEEEGKCILSGKPSQQKGSLCQGILIQLACRY